MRATCLVTSALLLTLAVHAAPAGSAPQGAPDAGQHGPAVEEDGGLEHDADERSRLSVDLKPEVAAGPAQVEIVIRVERDPDHRALFVAIDSGDYFRSTEIALDGAAAALHHVVVWRDVPAGQYTLTAIVSGSELELERLVLRSPNIVKP